MAYITTKELEDHVGKSSIPNASLYIDSAQEFIEKLAGGDVVERRIFEDKSLGVQTKSYDGNDREVLVVDDILPDTFDSLSIFDESQVQGDDFELYPLNAKQDNKPYEWIELLQPETRRGNVNSRQVSAGDTIFIFEKGQANVDVKAEFRYSDDPPKPVKIATLNVAKGMVMENLNNRDQRLVSKESLGEYSVSFAKIKDYADNFNALELMKPYIRKRPKGGSNIGLNKI